MGVLEQVSELRNQGMGDDEIVQNLRERGISPKAINDALSNEQVKKAVSDEYEESAKPSKEIVEENNSEIYEGQYAPQESQEYYSPGDYSQGYETQSQGFDSGTMVEISEQVFSEKIQKMQKQVDAITEFKSIAEGRIESISERLKRIEAVIDKMQISILEKVGSYGSNLDSIKKEMSMMQDTFSKVANNPRTNTAKPQQDMQKQQSTNTNSENFSRQQKTPVQEESFRQQDKKITKRFNKE